MEHKGVNFSVVQTASPTGWKWTVDLPPPQRTRSGNAFSRAEAVLQAIAVIDSLPPAITNV
jgi:hypothetical protein